MRIAYLAAAISLGLCQASVADIINFNAAGGTFPGVPYVEGAFTVNGVAVAPLNVAVGDNVINTLAGNSTLTITSVGNFMFNGLMLGASASGIPNVSVSGTLLGSAVGTAALYNTTTFIPAGGVGPSVFLGGGLGLFGSPIDTLTIQLGSTFPPATFIDNIDLTPVSATVPEPSSFALFAIVGLGYAGIRRKRQRDV